MDDMKCFKAVRKEDGIIAGWGKSKSLKEYSAQWDLRKVYITEITAEENQKLWDDLNEEERRTQ